MRAVTIIGGSRIVNDWSLAALAAALGAFVTGLFAWIVQRAKSAADKEVAVIVEWEKLTGRLSERLSTVESEFSAYRLQVAKDFEDLRKQHRAEMKRMREYTEGLERQIAQNSQSSAHLLGKSPVPKDNGNGK